MESIHWLWTVTSFWVPLWKLIMLWLFKYYPWNSYSVIIFIHKIVVLNLFSSYSIYLITWPIINFKILQKLLYDNILWIVYCVFIQFIILKLFIKSFLVPHPILSSISKSSLDFVIHKAPISRDEIMKLKIKDENKRCLKFSWWHIWETSLKKTMTLFMRAYFGFHLILWQWWFLKLDSTLLNYSTQALEKIIGCKPFQAFALCLGIPNQTLCTLKISLSNC